MLYTSLIRSESRRNEASMRVNLHNSVNTEPERISCSHVSANLISSSQRDRFSQYTTHIEFGVDISVKFLSDTRKFPKAHTRSPPVTNGT